MRYSASMLLVFLCVLSGLKASGQDPKEVSDDLADKIDIRIYPNPSFGEFTFEARVESSEKLSLKLYDLTGKLLKDLSNGLEKENGRISVKVRLDKDIYGLHFIRLEAGGTVHTRKILFR